MADSTKSESLQTYKLSPEELQHYKENGYLVIKKLIGEPTLDIYRHRFQQYCDGYRPIGAVRVIKEPQLVQQNAKPDEYINKLHDVHHDDVFISYGTDPTVLSVVSQLIGDDLTVVTSIFVNKPPGASRHPPHQDLFYFPFRPAEKIVASWTAVDPINFENGCLYVIPGSHRSKELYAHQRRQDTLRYFHGVDEATLAPPDKYVHLEMSPGDTVFFHPCLLHGSGANVSKMCRKAISFHFANSSCHYIDTSGTVQEVIVQDMLEITKNFGINLSFVDMFRVLNKHVKGVRSNL